MKILHVSSALSWRGGEQQIAWLIEELQALGLEQALFAPAGKPLAQWANQKGIPCHEYQKKGSVSFSTARLLAKHGQPYDLVHMHDSHAHTYAVMAASFFGLKQPLILNRRVDFPIGTNWSSRWKYNHSSIKKIICVSEFIRQLVIPKIKASAKVITIHSGANLNKFENVPKGKLYELLKIDKDVPLVGNVAAIAPHKDYFTFVDACERISAQNKTVEFVIIGGDGGEATKIREYINSKGLQRKIHLLGFRNDVPALLQDLSVFLFSSKTEGLGTSLLDAALAGLPIVATRAGGIPEIIQHGENGLLAAVQDGQGLAAAVLKILDTPGLAAELAERGKVSVRRFSKQETARKVLAVYDEVKS